MDRIKMRLMLGTHSTFGVDVFRDVQSSVEKEEMAIRTSLRWKGRNTHASSPMLT